MWKLDALLDPEAGAALRTAIEALSNRAGSADQRSPKQRRVDALGAIVHHALDGGTLPRRNGARPHVAVHTTIEGLQGAPGSTLEDGTPIASTTAQRLACDGTLSRVVKAGSVVVDVGRATRPGHAVGLAGTVASPQGPPPNVRVSRLRQAYQLDQSASHRVLVAWRQERSSEPLAPLLLPPPPGARRRVADRARRRTIPLHASTR